jgi:hypothetical protein
MPLSSASATAPVSGWTPEKPARGLDQWGICFRSESALLDRYNWAVAVIFVARGHVFAYNLTLTTPPTPLRDAHQGGYFLWALLGVALIVEKPPALEHLDAF